MNVPFTLHEDCEEEKEEPTLEQTKKPDAACHGKGHQGRDLAH